MAELAAAVGRLPGGPRVPGGAAGARRPLHLAGVHRGPGAVGRRPHRRDLLAAVAPLEQRGRPRDAPADRRRARRRRVTAGRRELVQATLDLVRGWASPTPSPTTPAGAAGSSTSGRAPSTRRWHRADRRDDVPARRVAGRPQGRGRPALGRGVRPRRGRVADPDAGRGLGRRHPGRPPAVDRRGRRAGRHRQGGLGRGRAGRRSTTRTASSTPRPPRSPGSRRRGRCWPAGAPPGSADRRPARECPRVRGCRGSARRCRRPRWRPRGSWRPGRTPSTSTRRSASSPRSTTGSGTWPTSACAPATSPSPPTGSSRPPTSSASSLTAPSGEAWGGARRTRRRA